MSAPNPERNPYDPYAETARYRAFRDGWAAQRERRPRTANPYPFAHVNEVLAWLDGWMAAIGEEERVPVGRRQREEARQIEKVFGTRRRGRI